MDRRSLLKMVATLTGAAVVGGDLFLSGCQSPDKKMTAFPLSQSTISLLDEIGETIIPATETPGAKAAAVGAFMNTMVMDCYSQSEKEVFIKGIDQLNQESVQLFQHDFIAATPDQRKELLIKLDKAAQSYQKDKKEDEPVHYFTLIKQLTLLGYFTSKPGATQALRYLAIPQKYVGDIPYEKGEKAWATS
ncbi:MAG: twin-arginine translocation signal domain-containing protein [Terrimonas sp.]|nr:twin-arginine translocation signal domain-containing protein [Terrimonas sp.]